MKAFTILIGLNLVVLLVTACSDVRSVSGDSCDQYVDQVVLKLDPSTLQGQGASENWVKMNFGANATNVRWSRHTDGRFSLDWIVGNQREYSLQFDSNELGTSLGVYWPQRRPAVSDLFRCLGTPDGYRALYRIQPSGIYTIVDFVYPGKGVVFGTYSSGKLRVTSNTEAQALGVSKPENGLESWNNRLLELNGSERVGMRDGSVLAFKPWPGSLEKMEYIDTTVPSQ